MANSSVTTTTKVNASMSLRKIIPSPLKTMEFGATTRAQSLICVNTKMAWSKIYSSDAQIRVVIAF